MKVFNESLLSDITSEEDFNAVMQEFTNSEGFILLEDSSAPAGYKLQLSEDVYKDMTEAFDLEVELASLPPGVGARIVYPEAQMADRPNRNTRIYKFEDMVPASKKFNILAKRGEVLVLNSHPSWVTGTPTMEDVSALVRKVEFDEATGKQSVILDIMKDSAPMKILEMGGALPISSRATARVAYSPYYEGKFGKFGRKPKEDKDGNIIKDDKYYEKGFLILSEITFLAYDFVAGIQSVPGAIHRPKQKNNIKLAANEMQTEQIQESAQQSHSEITMDAEMKEILEKLAEKQAAFESTITARFDKQDADEVSKATKDALSAKDAEIVELKASADALTTEVAELTEKLESATKEAEPVVISPELKEARELAEALKTELAERKEADEVAKADKDAAEYEVKVLEALSAGKYSAYKELMKAVIGKVASDEDVKESVELAEKLVHGILSTYRKSTAETKDDATQEVSRLAAMENINDNLPVAGADRVPFQENESQSDLSVMMGDSEDANAFG